MILKLFESVASPETLAALCNLLGKNVYGLAADRAWSSDHGLQCYESLVILAEEGSGVTVHAGEASESDLGEDINETRVKPLEASRAGTLMRMQFSPPILVRRISVYGFSFDNYETDRPDINYRERIETEHIVLVGGSAGGLESRLAFSAAGFSGLVYVLWDRMAIARKLNVRSPQGDGLIRRKHIFVL